MQDAIPQGVNALIGGDRWRLMHMHIVSAPELVANVKKKNKLHGAEFQSRTGHRDSSM